MNFTENKKDIIAISALLIIVSAITLLLLNMDGKAGVYYVRDVYFYLNSYTRAVSTHSYDYIPVF